MNQIGNFAINVVTSDGLWNSVVELLKERNPFKYNLK